MPLSSVALRPRAAVSGRRDHAAADVGGRARTVNVSVDAVASASETWSPKRGRPSPFSVRLKASVPITGPVATVGRCVRRTIRADKGDGQRLISGMAMTVADLCEEFDLQYVAGMQEVEIGVDRLIGPVQDNRSAVARRGVERHVRGIHQRRYVDAPGTDDEPLYSIVALPVTNAVKASPISASWTLSVPLIGSESPVRRRNVSGRNVVDLECVLSCCRARPC